MQLHQAEPVAAFILKSQDEEKKHFASLQKGEPAKKDPLGAPMWGFSAWKSV